MSAGGEPGEGWMSAGREPGSAGGSGMSARGDGG
jgi:hypothetical protein